MDLKLSLLTAFDIYDFNKYVPEDIVQEFKILISLFVEEIISDEEYQQILDLLCEDNYITRKGDKLQVTQIGAALVDVASEKVLGHTNVERLKQTLQNYENDRRKYLSNVNEQLRTLHSRREQKAKGIDGQFIRAVGILVSLDYTQDHLIENYYEFPPHLLRQEEILTSEINYAAKRITQKNRYPIVVQKTEKGCKLITFSRLGTLTILGQSITLTRSNQISRTEVKNWNETVVLTHVEQCLKPLGYTRSSRSGRIYTNYQETKSAKTNIGILRENPSFRVDYSVLKNDSIFLWLESFMSPSMRVLDFLSDNVTDGRDPDIFTILSDLKLRVLPSGMEVELLKVLDNVDLNTELVPDRNQTYSRYWEGVLNNPLTETHQPLLIVKAFHNELHYPAEMVYVDKHSMEKYFGETANRQIQPSSPSDRFKQIQELFFSIRDSNINYQKQFVKINMDRYAPTASELIDHKAIKSVLRIRPPILEFANGVVSTDPLDIFQREYNPICDKKHLTVSHIILPSDLRDVDIDKFIQKLGREFSRFGFGSISKDKNVKIVEYKPHDNITKLEDKLRLASKLTNNSIAIGVVPDQSNKHYYVMKRLFPMRAETPIQIVKLSTVEDTVKNRFRGMQMLCLKILVKSLKVGETIWRLSNSAGLLQDKSLYAGIGFSRKPREKKVSKCAAVLHDSLGGRISWKIFSTPQERTITTQWFNTLLRQIRDTIEQENPKRVVFYRTGTLHLDEKKVIQDAIENLPWMSEIRVSFVSILDGSNNRFYTFDKRQNRYGNLPAGYAIITSENEALLATSNYDARRLRHGTVVPVRLRLEFGDDDIVDIVKEYHDQTYVYWLAPFTTTKKPLVTTIADRFAELTREGVSRENFFYLDL